MTKSLKLKKFISIDLNNSLLKSISLEDIIIKNDEKKLSVKNNKKQKIYCMCGNTFNITASLKRNMVLNEEITEDTESISEIKCPKCELICNHENGLLALKPNVDCLYDIKYNFVKRKNLKDEEVFFLEKRKEYLYYSTAKAELLKVYAVDYIKFNSSTKKITTFIDTPLKDRGNYSGSIEAQEILVPNIKHVSEEISISKVNRINDFFEHYNYIHPQGFYHIFNFIKKIESFVCDLDKIKEIFFIKNYYNFMEYSKIEIEENGNERFYAMQRRGFGSNKIIKKYTSNGNLLKSAELICKLYVSVISYPNITTIFLTKKHEFFLNFINEGIACHPNVYKEHKSTNPYNILEITASYDKHGRNKFDSETKLKTKPSEENENVIKTALPTTKEQKLKSIFEISPTIYNSIIEPGSLEIVYNVQSKKIMSKHEMEYLLQNFDRTRMYNLFEVLQTNKSDIFIKINHINHIINAKLDIERGEDETQEFLQTYCDTLNLIKLLEFDEAVVLKEIKNIAQLKDKHDVLSAKYNSIKDAKKAEIFLKRINEVSHLNDTIEHVTFTVIPTLEKLNREGKTMSHCIYSYLDRICDRKYIAIHVQHDISNERATMGLMYTQNGISFDQLKGYMNSRATAYMIDKVIKYFHKHNITNNSSNSDLTISPSYEKKMKDYKSEEEVNKILLQHKKDSEGVIKKTKSIGSEIKNKIKNKFLFL